MHLSFTIRTVVSTISITTSVCSKASPIRSQQDVVEMAVLFAVYDKVQMMYGEQAGGAGRPINCT